MADVPVISIDEVEDLVDDQDESESLSVKPNINECHTDVEELESDNDHKKIHFLVSSLKTSVKCNGAVTDVEDLEDSDDDEEPKEEVNYGPEISLNEYLDQGFCDEHSNLQGNVNKQKLQATRSVAKTPSPTAFHLTINSDIGGTTDVEDLEGSGDEVEEEKVYSDDDKAIILEDANIVDVHDSLNRKKTEKYAPRIVEQSTTSSDSEDEKCKSKPRSKKHFLKSSRCEEAKSDVENIYFSDDGKYRASQKSTPILDTPDIEVIAFDESDNEDLNKNDQKFPEINITFMANDEKKKKKLRHKATPAPSPMLALPDNQDEAVTDVENLNSSDDDEEGVVKMKTKGLMPLAIVKSDALTDVEDFSDQDSDENGDDSNLKVNENPDILPSPVREYTVLVENKNGEPYKHTNPLPDNVLLGFDNYEADKGLTDVEDFSDESGDDEDESPKYKEVDILQNLDGGFVESSDHSVVKESNLRIAHTPEPKTDTEDIFVMKKPEKPNELRKRRTKTKHGSKPTKSTFLDTKFYVDDEASAHTDVEDLHVADDDVVLKDKNVQRRATIECTPRKSSNGGGKTDVEYLSGGDDNNIDLMRFTPDISIELNVESGSVTFSKESSGKKSKKNHDLNIPTIRRTSATPRSSLIDSLTDVENIQCDSDIDECFSYSRAQTATPIEINHDLHELSVSEVHDVLTRDYDRSREYLEVKGNQDIAEAHTDIEYID